MPVRMTIDVEGLARGLGALGARGQAAAMAGADAAAKVVETGIKRQLRTYTHAKKTPTPSPPGRPPALVSGRLWRSVETRPGPGYVDVGPTAVYGRIQELGGMAGRGHHTPLPARPYVRPGFQASAALARTAASDAIRRTLGI